MLGEVSLYQGKWTEAIGYFHQVERLGFIICYSTNADNFKLANENSPESIFEIQHRPIRTHLPAVR